MKAVVNRVGSVIKYGYTEELGKLVDGETLVVMGSLARPRIALAAGEAEADPPVLRPLIALKYLTTGDIGGGVTGFLAMDPRACAAVDTDALTASPRLVQ